MLAKRSLGKLASAENLTAAMDEVDYLQVYIHDFEDWDGESELQATFTPLTVNDVDVTELTMYDSLGSTYTLEVDTIPPEYPLMVVGINESMTINEELGSTYTDSTLWKITTEKTIHITKINLDWSAWHYEPWFMGTHAELYIRVYEGNYSGGIVNQANWFTFGLYAPEGSNKSYKCWKWRWGWKQTKPWRTVNINTGWPENTFPSSNNFTFRLMEYDPIIYDGGIDNWCGIAGVLLGAVTAGGGSVFIGPLSVNIGLIVGIST